MGDEMPTDPFREGQPDWVPLAANNHAFYLAHVAAGMPDGHALELTKTYLTFMLGMSAANAASQEQQAPGDV
jgi:hypothetical protein